MLWANDKNDDRVNILDTAPKYINTLELNSLGYLVRPKYNGYEAVGFNLGNSLSLCYPRISQAIIKKRDELAANTDNRKSFALSLSMQKILCRFMC